MPSLAVRTTAPPALCPVHSPSAHTEPLRRVRGYGKRDRDGKRAKRPNAECTASPCPSLFTFSPSLTGRETIKPGIGELLTMIDEFGSTLPPSASRPEGSRGCALPEA